MTLKTKLPLYSSIILFFALIIISGYALYSYKVYINKNIQDFKKEYTNLVINHLKDIVNIAYRMIDESYKISEEQMKKNLGFNLDTIPEDIAKMIRVNMLKITLQELRTIRYGKDGYLWINEYNPPYKVIMHGANPKLEGKSWIFFLTNTSENIYKVFHDSIELGGGEARVSYTFYKPGTKKRVPKISWVKLYKPLNWVIGTGVYVDEIQQIVEQKKKEMRHQLITLARSMVLITLIMLIFSVGVIYFLAQSITTPIQEVERTLSDLAKGKLVEPKEMNLNDEIGQMSKSLVKLTRALRQYAKFAQNIGKGNFDVEFKPLSRYDVLGNELLLMRDRLREARKKELQQLEIEKKRHWVMTGVSMFTDLITANSSDIENLCNIVLHRLLDYVGAVVGAIFLVRFVRKGKLELPYLEQMVTIAYDKRRIIQKRLEINEGLVGACFMERQPINITDVPEGYIQVRTGLGGSLPRNIFLAPIHYETKTLGVIEIASFEVLDEYKRELIVQVAQSLAISLSTHPYYMGKNLDADEMFEIVHSAHTDW